MPAPLLAVPSLPPLAPPRPAPLPSKAAQKPAVSAPPPPTFEALLANARDANATDLHLIAGRPPLHRVAGELRPGGPVVAADALERMILPKVPPRLSAALAEGGSCDFALASLMHGRFRVNVSRQQTGLKVCLRVVSKELPTVESLRLPEEVAAAADQAQGLVLFTGPAGQGKTTTMSAVVDRLNEAAGRHIIAVDDPVEHLHLKKAALLSQREVGTHTASFVAALKAALREDPDVIVVGELHDVEVARLALAASQTGRLVLATMSTGGPACAIDRLLELFPLREQPHVRRVVAAALRLVVGQRLVPGRDGRSVHAAFEVLATTPSLAGLIRDGATTEIVALRQGALTPGSLRLDRSLAELVADDRVTLEAARGVAESPGDLDAALDELRAAPR